MRSVSDRGLPEPYRTWIDRSGPLPAGVRLLPRTVDVGTDVVTFLGVGGMFGGMGALMLVLLRPWRLDPVRDGWAPVLIMGAILLALGSVPVLLLRRMVRTLGARADLRRGERRRSPPMFHEFAERLARRIDVLEKLVARRGPAREPPGQSSDIGVADVRQA